jgi:hypothetical protein
MSEFDDGERWVVERALKERYGQIVKPELADVELKLQPGDAQLATCPTLFWEQRGAAFVIAKTGQDRYRAMFFYPGDPAGEQYGAGQLEYRDLAECTLAVLRAQADHEKLRQGVASGDTALDLEDPDAPE